MARYRVGNSYLSQHEYDQHIFECIVGVLMISGALLGGLLAYKFSSADWPKLIRLGFIVGVSIYFGYKSAQYHAIILIFTLLGLMGFIGCQLLSFLSPFL